MNEPPSGMLTGEAQFLFQGYQMLKQYSIFPIAGGWLEQSVNLLFAVEFCDKVNAAYCQREHWKKEEAKKLAKRLKGILEDAG